MLSRDEPTALAVEQAMKSIYDRIGLNYYTYVTTISRQGVTFIA